MRPEKISIIGSPLDFGSPRPGANMAPMALRHCHFFSILRCNHPHVQDLGDVPLPYAQQILSSASPSQRHPTHLPPTLPQSWCYSSKVQDAVRIHLHHLAQRTYRCVSQSSVPLVLGGDHAVAIGSLWGVIRACQEQKKRLGIVWFDAHLDLHTPTTSPSGNLHGMALSYALGHGDDQYLPPPADMSFSASSSAVSAFSSSHQPQVYVIGARSMEEPEKELARKLGIHVFTAIELQQPQQWQRAMETLENTLLSNIDHLHLSCDLDGFDPQWAPGVSTPVSGGLTPTAGKELLARIARSGKLGSLEFTEVNPLLDPHQRTSELTSELITTVFGTASF